MSGFDSKVLLVSIERLELILRQKINGRFGRFNSPGEDAFNLPLSRVIQSVHHRKDYAIFSLQTVDVVLT